MNARREFYFGNASADRVRGTGWFVGQFIPAAIGARHQTALELKWGVHPDGEHRKEGAAADGYATTISVLIRGALRMWFDVDGSRQEMTLNNEGDYVIFGPEIVHSWQAIGETLVLSVRFPSVEHVNGTR